MVDLDGIRKGDRIRVRARTRTGRRVTLTGEVVSIYALRSGSVSFLAIVTGQSANRSRRYVGRHDTESLEVLERAGGEA